MRPSSRDAKGAGPAQSHCLCRGSSGPWGVGREGRGGAGGVYSLESGQISEAGGWATPPVRAVLTACCGVWPFQDEITIQGASANDSGLPDSSFTLSQVAPAPRPPEGPSAASGGQGAQETAVCGVTGNRDAGSPELCRPRSWLGFGVAEPAWHVSTVSS